MESTRPMTTRPDGLGQLCAAMAHDVRGPANILSITSELLESVIERACAGEVDAARLRRLTETMKLQSRRLARRLDVILQSYCGPDNPVPVSVFELGSLAAEAVRHVTSRAMPPAHPVAFEAPDRGLLVLGQPAVLRRAVAEIVTNAVEASPAGGRISVRVSADEDDSASITVSDAGPGIPPDALERVFERDFTTREPGRGFGLYFAREAVRAHGGRISAESAESAESAGIGGPGCTIRVTLPLHRKET